MPAVGADGPGGGLGGPWNDDDDLAGDLTAAEVIALDMADGPYDDPAWLEELYAEDFPPEESEESEESEAAGGAEILHAGFTHEEPVERGPGFITACVIDPFGNILGVMYNRHYLEILTSRAGA